MIAGCLDIGTNTTLALLAEESGDTLHTLRDTLTHNRLGESLSEDGTLSPHAIALNVDLIHEIVRDFKIAGAERIMACGTAALRRAKNRDEFISAVRDITGVEVRIISGTDEAAMTYAGALSGLEVFPNEHISAVDIGGGSTEIIEGTGGVPATSCSLDTGAVYLTRTYCKNDPPTDSEILAVRNDAKNRIASVRDSFGSKRTQWILIGGTPVSLAILKQGITRYEPSKVAGVELSLSDIEEFVSFFRHKRANELQALSGMPMGRGRYIFAGTLLLRELYSEFEIASARVSERGLRHGFWLKMFGSRKVK